jgi:polyferredoxin
MNRAFKIMLVLGILLTLVGVGVGFTAMFIDAESELAVYFIGIVPVGFLLTFASLTGWILAGGK